MQEAETDVKQSATTPTDPRQSQRARGDKEYRDRGVGSLEIRFNGGYAITSVSDQSLLTSLDSRSTPRLAVLDWC